MLARSEDHDPLTWLPVSIKMNPLRDRSTEKAANVFLREIRDGHCDDVLAKWEHDYHKKYAHYLCDSEAKHPLLSWELVEWEEAGPLIILHYRGKRESNAGPNQPGIDSELSALSTQSRRFQAFVRCLADCFLSSSVPLCLRGKTFLCPHARRTLRLLLLVISIPLASLPS